MKATDDLVEGWSGPLDYTLKINGAAINGIGFTLTIQIRDRANGLVPVTGEVTWADQANGVARYTPASTDLKAERSPYQARFKVTDSFGSDTFFPNAEALVWAVRK
jgi:hypothetical protein